MATPVVMPQMGLEVTEGTVAAIHVAVGARVAEGDPLVELETDKALTEVVAPRDGFVISIEVEVGDVVPLGTTLVGARRRGRRDRRRPRPRAGGRARRPALPARLPRQRSPAPSDGRLRAAPVARRAAERLGVALATVTGTGPRGRITLEGRRARRGQGGNGASAAPQPAPARARPAAPAPAAGERLEPLSATRRAVARRMAQSQQIPQFTLHREIDATWLLAEKGRLAAETEAKVGVNDLLVQALAETVLRHPDLAASFVDGQDGGHPQLRRREGVDVGLAVATDSRAARAGVPPRARAHAARARLRARAPRRCRPQRPPRRSRR